MPVKAATTGFPAAAEHSARTPAIFSTVRPRAGSSATTTAWTESEARVPGRLSAQGRQRQGHAGVEVHVGDDPFHAQPVRGGAVRHHFAERPGVAEDGDVRAPAGSGWPETIWATSMSCSMVSTRITPAWRIIASRAPAGAWVVRTACPGGSCRPMASDLATITGLVRASRRASRENLRGLPMDSR